VRDRLRRRLDVPALAAGAGVGLATLGVVALVAARIDPAVSDPDSSGSLVGVLLLVAVVGLVAAGSIAARRCRRSPLAHGAGAAMVAVVVAAAAAVVRQVAVDEPIRWWPVAVWLLLALACGTTGGLAALRAPRAGGEADSPG
jgi:ribose/xylose/arabinose/galactoside ABC-type transport system permease subunit